MIPGGASPVKRMRSTSTSALVPERHSVTNAMMRPSRRTTPTALCRTNASEAPEREPLLSHAFRPEPLVRHAAQIGEHLVDAIVRHDLEAAAVGRRLAPHTP